MHFVQPPSVRPMSTLRYPSHSMMQNLSLNEQNQHMRFRIFRIPEVPAPCTSKQHCRPDQAAQPSQTPFGISTPARSHAQTHPVRAATPQSMMGAISHAKCINMATENANLPLPPESPNCQRLNGFLVLLTTQYSCLTELQGLMQEALPGTPLSFDYPRAHFACCSACWHSYCR